MKYTLSHIGINCADEAAAKKAAALACMLFGWQEKDGPNSVYADTAIECLKKPGFGANGHIGIGVSDVPAAVEELKARGFAFRPGSEKYTADGKLRLVYLEDEICGFALHLTLV